MRKKDVLVISLIVILMIVSTFFLVRQIRIEFPENLPSCKINFALSVILLVLQIALLIRYGLSMDWVSLSVLVPLLMVVAYVDWRSFRIPNKYLVYGIAWWLFVFAARMVMGFDSETVLIAVSNLGGAFLVAGAIVVFGSLFEKLTTKSSLGAGDVKLYFLITLFLGLEEGLICVFLSSVFGLVTALMFAIKGNKRGEAFPFGPAIVCSVFCVLLWC